MGDPVKLQEALGKPAIVPPVDESVPTKPVPPIDPNESDQAPPAPGKATKKPLKITAPFMPKSVDRVSKLGVGGPVVKEFPAVTKDIPAVIVKVKDDQGNSYDFVKEPAKTVVVEPARMEVVNEGGCGFLNGENGPRDRSKKQDHKHVYVKPPVNVALQIAMDKRKAK